ncbi:MAG TPA: hypothetical protein VFX30_05450 [bacterium]|nr:hypothetical protein [bacterium]
MSCLIPTYAKITITDENHNGQLDEGDTVTGHNPNSNMPEETSVRTFWSGTYADRLQLLAQAKEQKINADRFAKQHPLNK